MRKFLQIILTSLSALTMFACAALGTSLYYISDWLNGDKTPSISLIDHSLLLIQPGFGLALSFITVASVFGVFMLLIFLTPLRRLFREYELIVQCVTYDPDTFQPLRFKIPVVLSIIVLGMTFAGSLNGSAVATSMMQFAYWPITTITFINEIALLGATIVMYVRLSRYTGLVFYKAPAIDQRGTHFTITKYCDYMDLDREVERSKEEYLRDCKAFLSGSRF